jgi:hypothetical protein
MSRVGQGMKQTYLYLWYVSADIRITVCGKKISKGSNHDSKNGLRSSMPEGGTLDATMTWLTFTEYLYDK